LERRTGALTTWSTLRAIIKHTTSTAYNNLDVTHIYTKVLYMCDLKHYEKL